MEIGGCILVPITTSMRDFTSMVWHLRYKNKEVAHVLVAPKFNFFWANNKLNNHEKQSCLCVQLAILMLYKEVIDD